MVTMSAVSRAGPLFVVPLSSLCARHAAKSCQKHGRLKPSQFRSDSASFGLARALCGLPGISSSGSGVWLDRPLGEVHGSRRRKPLLRWEEQRRWTRAWRGQNLTWNEEQSPYETLGERCEQACGVATGEYNRQWILVNFFLSEDEIPERKCRLIRFLEPFSSMFNRH